MIFTFDGNLLTEDSERRRRWQEQFEEILNRPIPDNPVSNKPNEHDEQVLEDISTDCISKAEIIRAAIRKMRNGKSGGKDEITVELLKADIDTTVDWLADLFSTIWEQELVPKAWKQGLIVKLAKKGNLSECGNWRGITLTSLPSEVFGRVLIDRIGQGVDSKLRDLEEEEVQ